MLIKSQDLPLFEQVYEFLRANYFVHDYADYSHCMGRSRGYVPTLRYNGKLPSDDAYRNLQSFMSRCWAETQDADLKAWLDHYMRAIDEVL